MLIGAFVGAFALYSLQQRRVRLEALKRVHLVCTFQVKDARGFKAAIAPLLATSKLEPGCVKYELTQAEPGSSLYTLIEEWEDQAALDAHNESGHFKRYVPMLGPTCSVSVDKLLPAAL